MGDPHIIWLNKQSLEESGRDPRVELNGAKFESISKDIPRELEMILDILKCSSLILRLSIFKFSKLRILCSSPMDGPSHCGHILFFFFSFIAIISQRKTSFSLRRIWLSDFSSFAFV
uniref:Putative ovule protein n=1 Tax=Solanum chacoense TaxID=4108 RepID=A0A0V0GWV0_SOLCH